MNIKSETNLRWRISKAALTMLDIFVEEICRSAITSAHVIVSSFFASSRTGSPSFLPISFATQRQHDRRVEHMRVMGELHTAVVFLRDHLNVAQTQTAVVGFVGDISPIHLPDLAMKAIVHSDGQHLTGATHMKLDEPVFLFSAVCSVDGIFQQITQNDGEVNIWPVLKIEISR